jgi:hypothetical protein
MTADSNDESWRRTLGFMATGSLEKALLRRFIWAQDFAARLLELGAPATPEALFELGKNATTQARSGTRLGTRSLSGANGKPKATSTDSFRHFERPRQHDGVCRRDRVQMSPHGVIRLR